VEAKSRGERLEKLTDQRCGSAALQVQSLEFKLQSHQKRKKKNLWWSEKPV
jgi:hypothetical protein